MFRELVELGRDLEQRGQLPPPGFYEYGDPIRWIVHLLPDRVYIEGAELDIARPYSGRTSGVEEHLLSDEAGYALAVAKQRDGGEDGRAGEKHRRFRALHDSFLASDLLQDKALREAMGWLTTAIDRGSIASDARLNEIKSKDWVSFMPEQGPLTGTHLFQHPEAKAFWLREMQRRTSGSGARSAPASTTAECAVCGKETAGLVRKLPVGVKLAGTVPLHSLNGDAFTSYIGGAGTADKAHLGICFECGDTAARAFNFLSNSDRHRRTLVRDRRKRDGLGNQIALFWLKAPAPLRVAEEVFDLWDLVSLDLSAVLGEPSAAPQAALSQLLDLLRLPWHPIEASLRLDDYAFYLAVLSPNVGRIAVREWIAVSLARLKGNLAAFLEASRIVGPWGDPASPVSIRTMVDAIASANPNLTRALLHSAYAGTKPPGSLAVLAGQRLNVLIPFESTLRERQRSRRREQGTLWDERWPHALAAAIKLGLVYGTTKEEAMEEVNPLFQSKGYHCGRLLAVLVEAQQVYHYRQHHHRLDTTIVNRSYGGASSAPKSTFVPLLRLAATSHLPEAGGRLNQEVEAIVSTLVGLGGMPQILSLPEQAEFGLGFYHQRAQIRARRPNSREGPDLPTEADAE